MKSFGHWITIIAICSVGILERCGFDVSGAGILDNRSPFAWVCGLKNIRTIVSALLYFQVTPLTLLCLPVGTAHLCDYENE